MFSFKKLAFVLLITALFLNACGSAAAPAAVQNEVETIDTVIFADPQLELLYQVAKSNNPQMSYTDEQYRQIFFDWYGTNSKTIFANEFESASQNLAYVKSSEIIALKGGVPGWLYALAAWTITTTVIAMNAELAANLNLPTITLSTPPLKIVVPQSYSVATTSSLLNTSDELRKMGAVAMAGLVGIPGIITTENAVISIDVYRNSDTDGCYIGMGLSSSTIPDKDPLSSNIKDFVKHDGPCNKSDIAYLLKSLIRQVQECIDQAKKILQDPASVGATADNLAEMRELIELFPKIVNELYALLSTL